MEVNKKELKEQEIRTLFITPALQQKGWAVSVNMREEYYFTDGRVLVVGILLINRWWPQSRSIIRNIEISALIVWLLALTTLAVKVILQIH